MTDYIVIGSGSAGSVMAKRLSDAGFSVTVLEYGGTDKGPFIQMPAALSYPMNMKRYDWGYVSEPEPHLGGRQLACPRGKVIGGSSSINGMIYVRGNGGDYDYWAKNGAHGWGYADVLPYFKRMETAIGDEGYRGQKGELHITQSQAQNPIFGAFQKAAQQAGYNISNDYNGHCQEGFAATQFTVKDGVRFSSARAFLLPAVKGGKIKLITRAMVERILFIGNKATGVEYRHGKKSHKLLASRGIVVAAGAINSPKLLMLSGIGNGKDLKNHGINVLLDRPGVGANLQDHLELYLQMECLKPVSLYPYMNLFGKAWVGLQWLLFKKGLGTSPQFETVGFIRSDKGVDYPDIQFHVLPLAVRYDGNASVKKHSFQIHVGPMRSPSRGFVRLRSSDPDESPIVQFNYMSEEQDWQDFRTCIRLTREILAMPAMSDFSGTEIAPGAEVTSDEDLNSFIAKEVESAYHPSGTCKMGDVHDKMAVVDSECRVIGTENLWCADSSIFPRIPNGNLNAPSIMCGDKASDHVLGKIPLPPENHPAWTHPNWKTKQR